MKRTLTVIGAAVIAVVGAVAASQAQSPQNPQARGGERGGRPEFGCGPERGADDLRPGVPPGRGDQRPPVGAMNGRGRQGGIGRPGGPGGPGRGGRGNPLCALDLTEEQQTQIAAIHHKAQDEIEAILTPEQKEKLRALRGGRGAGR